MGINDAQRTAYAEQGILRLANVFTASDAQGMIDKIWGILNDKMRLAAYRRMKMANIIGYRLSIIGYFHASRSIRR
jgi:hypothetical protein